MLPPDLIGDVLARRSHGADIALIEGVMGLFDGYSGRDDTGSSAHIARLTDTPVLLVLDVRSQARTAAALVQGVRDFDPRVRVAGVVLNRVGSPKHAQMVTDAIEEQVGLPVVGALGRDETLHLPERHLGLIPTAEPGRWQAWLEQARALVAERVDLARVLELARAVSPLAPTPVPTPAAPPALPAGPRIAVARDAAFSFLYEDNLDLLRSAGAEPVFFSPLEDAALPTDTQALFLCGGFPELYAKELAANTAMRAAIREAGAASMPIYAECGGLMYLTGSVADLDGAAHEMVGLLPGHSAMTKRLTLGYRTVQATQDSWLWRAGETMRGHEFHYSQWQQRPIDTPPAYQIVPDQWQPEPRPDGAQHGSVFASYVHLHFLARPELAARFVAAAAAFAGTAQ
jgi:cobyrinic acid a,c-diamide synthase